MGGDNWMACRSLFGCVIDAMKSTIVSAGGAKNSSPDRLTDHACNLAQSDNSLNLTGR
jgi:hypothetical protein